MDTLQSYLALLVSFLLIIIYILKKRNIQSKNLPPSPPSLPIIGHLHLLKSPLNETIDSFTNKYGPVFLLRFGSRPMLVVSSRSAIEECFTKNDIIFANRPLLHSRKTLSYNFTSLYCPYGNNWRSIRRIFALEVFSAKRLLMSSDVRNEEIKFMIKHLSKDILLGKVVDMKSYFFMLNFNIIMRMVAGNRGFGEEEMMDIDNIAKGKIDYFNRIFDSFAEIVLSDYIPFLRWLSTCSKVVKKIVKAHREKDTFLQALIDAHRTSNHCSKSSNHGDQISPTLIDVLLKLQQSEPVYYTDTKIKSILEALPTAGTNGSVLTIIAAVSLLMSHPEILNKARNQIDNLVGQSRLLTDADLDNLPYLDCIIKETLRIISETSILLLHESSEECTVAGYRIPPGTQLLYNPSSVHRDPELWIEPDKFEPERFLNFEEQKGRCKFLGFGSGRRQCPGMSLAMRVLPLLLGTLIQCFDWEKAEGENHGVAKTKVNYSAVRFRPRESLSKVLAQL